jgi:acetate kinase
MNILVVNAGSSSLKLRVLGQRDDLVTVEDLPASSAAEIGQAVASFVESAPPIDAAGHRVVHGGTRFAEPVLLDAASEEALAALAELAPLHNPPSIAAIRALRVLRGDLPQVACFDTSFHTHMPEKAATYAISEAWRERFGIRRFGFHGLSHAWATKRGAALLGRPVGELRLVTAHLGAGASLAAVAQGTSVDTTMGFTPLEGLVMATRSGNIDPGLLLYVLRHGVSVEEVEEGLEHQSGLLGLSRISGDLREVLTAADRGHPQAQLAYEVFVYRIQTLVAAMAAAMRGVDALVCTGGAGAASPRLRSDIAAGLGFLGVELDHRENSAASSDAVVSSATAQVPVVVVESREDLEIARHVRELLA